MLPQRLIQPETEPVYLPPREMTEDQLALIAKPKAPRETDIQKMFIAVSRMRCDVQAERRNGYAGHGRNGTHFILHFAVAAIGDLVGNEAG